MSKQIESSRKTAKVAWSRWSIGECLVLAVFLAASGSVARAALPNFTIANNVFPSTPVGQSASQTVTVTLNEALAINSITIPAGFTEYSLGAITGCTINGSTVNASGTVCSIPVTFTPKAPGSSASASTARSAPLVISDIESSATVVHHLGLIGAATGPVLYFNPSLIERVAGVANTSYAARDNGLGNTSNGSAGNGGAATSATFAFESIFGTYDEPQESMVIDSASNLYVIDLGNNIIRRVDGTSGIITIVAGTQGGAAGYSGDGGAATSAAIGSENALVLDAGDNLYFINQGNTANSPSYVIRKVDAGTGIISSVAGESFTTAMEGSANCPTTGTSLPFQSVCGDGGQASVALIYQPAGLAMDSAGNIYILQAQGNIRKISATTGIISEVGNAYTSGSSYGFTIAADGNLYASVEDNTLSAYVIKQINPSNGTATVVMGATSNQPSATTCLQQGSAATAWFYDPNGSDVSAGISADGAGNIYGLTAFCSGGNSSLESDSATGLFRLNISSGQAYALTDIFQEGNGGGGNNNVYDSWLGFYQILPAFAVSDSAGDIYFQTFNQIGEITSSQGALDGYSSRDDFATDAPGTTCPTLTSEISTFFCQVAVINNVGNASLDVTPSLTDSADFTFLNTGDTHVCSASSPVTPGGYCDLDVEFTPVLAGTINGAVSIADNSSQGGGTQSLALTGTGIAEAEAQLTPAPYNFGPVPQGSPASEIFTLSNMGTATLSISSTFVTIQTPATFAITNNTCTSSLAAGSNCKITVTFTPPASSGSFTNTLTVNESAGSGTVTSALSAMAGPAAAPGASLTPSPLAFGGQVFGTTSQPLAATLFNTGTATLTGITPTIAGTNPSDFAIGTGTNACGATLAAGSSCSIYVTFTPASAAGFTATLQVADNASGSPQSINLTGTGVTFASSVGTAEASQSVTVTIATAGTLSSIQALTQGISGLDFTLGSAGSCATGTMYAVGQSCTVNVIFAPQASGIRYGSIVLSNSSGVVLSTTYLPGLGTGPEIVFDPGVQSTLVPASAGYYPFGIATDAGGNVYFIDNSGGVAYKMTETGSTYSAPVNIGSGYSEPLGIAVDGAGNVFVSDYFNHRVVEIPWNGSSYGTQSNLALGSTTREPRNIKVDVHGNVYFADYAFDVVVEVPWTGSGYGTPVVLPFTGLNSVNDIAIDQHGDVFAADTYNYQVVELPWNGTSFGAQVTAVPAANLMVGSSRGLPNGLALDPNNNLYIANQIQTGGGEIVMAPLTGSSYGTPVKVPLTVGATDYVALDSSGNVYAGTGIFGQVLKLDVSDPPSLTFASTDTGSSSTDSPKTVNATNYGNAPLTLTSGSAGSNPSYPTSFPANSADANLCAPGAAVAPGASCDISVKFTPTTGGSLSGNAVISDNTLNVPGSSQAIAVSGTGIQTLTAQAITFTQPATPVVYSSSIVIPLSATGGASGNPVLFTLDASSTYTGTYILTGSSLTVTSVGSYVIDANQAGNASYTAAPQVQRTVVVTQAPQTINFAQPTSPVTYSSGLTIPLSATGGASGNTVTFSIDASSTGSGSVSGTTLTVTGVGTFVIDANQAGNANYSAATQVQRSIVVNSLTAQAIIFTQPATPVVYSSGLTIPLSATGGASGNPVVFTLDGSSTGAGSVSGTTLTVTGVGSFVIDANQAGNSTYSAAPQVQRTVVVTQASQTITFTQPTTPVTYTSGLTIPLSATGGASGNAVTFSIDASSTASGSVSGATLTVTGTGTLVIDANQAGNANYSAATQAQRTVAVNAPGAQAITFTQPATPVVYASGLSIPLAATGGASGNPVVFTLDAISNGAGSISGTTLTVTGVGTFVVDANQAGNASYTAAPQVQRSVVVTQAPQAIAFTQPNSPVTFASGLTVSLSATGGASGNAVVFTIDSSSTGTGSISGGTLTVTGAGNIVIDANQAGNANYSAAAQVQKTVVVNVPAPDFGVASTTPSQSIAHGASAMFTINVTDSGSAFTSPVTLSVTGLPTGATGTFNPPTVTPGSSSGTSTLTVQLPAQTAMNHGSDSSARLVLAGIPAIASLLSLVLLLPVRRARKLWRNLLLALVAIGALGATAALSGCGGGFALTNSSQTYTLTVTGTSGEDTHSTTVQLTVQ